MRRFHLPQAEQINGRAAVRFTQRRAPAGVLSFLRPARLMLRRPRASVSAARQMIGFATGYLVDALTGAGLVDQTNNFFGKLLMWTTFVGVAFIRSTADLEQYKELLKEATFYDKQWQATWENAPRPSEKEQ